MPYLEQMNWDGSKRRWHRYHRGVMYRLPASSLGPDPSREATRTAANAWWQRKLAELTIRTTDISEQLDTTVLHPLIVTQADADRLPPPVDPGRTLRTTGQAFLAVIRTTMKPLSFREIRLYIQSAIASDQDVSIFTEERVERMYLELRNSSLSDGVKKKRWGFLRRYIKYLWERRLIDLPRNLQSHGFEVQPQAIVTCSPAEVRQCLAILKPRLQLYCYLGLNAGMTAADIGQLKKHQLDLNAATLKRKRVKTEARKSVPEITYKLWSETCILLTHCWSDHPVLALTSMDGTALWESRQEGDKTPQKDLIHQQLKRARCTITHKHFRSISATWLESHPTFGRYVSYFLGHSPKGMAERHYAAPSNELFAEALSWLRKKLSEI